MTDEILAVVDRIVDGRHAVLIAGDEEYVVPASQLPDGAEQGSWLRVQFGPGGIVTATVDDDETKRRRKRITEKVERLRERRGKNLDG